MTRNDDSLRQRIFNAVEYLATRNDPLTVRVRDAFTFQVAPILIDDYRQPDTRALAQANEDDIAADGGIERISDATAQRIANRLVEIDRAHRPLYEHERKRAG